MTAIGEAAMVCALCLSAYQVFHLQGRLARAILDNADARMAGYQDAIRYRTLRKFAEYAIDWDGWSAVPNDVFVCGKPEAEILDDLLDSIAKSEPNW